MMLSMLRNPVARAVAVAVVLVVWLGLAGVGGAAQGKLSQVQTNDAAAFLPSSAQSTRAAEASRDFVDSQTLPALVVLTPAEGGDVTPEQLAAAAELAGTFPQRTVGDGTWADHLTGPIAPVPSQDGEAILLAVPFDAEDAETLVGDEESLTKVLVADLREALADELGATATEAGDLGLQAWVTGPAGFVSDLSAAFAGIDGILLLVALGAVLLILVVVYRSPFLPLVVILTAVFALAFAGLVVYELAKADVLVLNGQAQGILSILVVGAAVDYSLLLVARYREELRHAAHPVDAMRVAWRQSLEPIAASAGTVVAGLLCLLLSDLGSNRSLGPVAAVGIGAALLAGLTLLPAMLLVAGRRSRALFWPRAPRPEATGATPGEGATRGEGATAGVTAEGDGLWARWARFVARRARPTWVVTAVVLLVAAAFVPTFRATGTSQTDVFLTAVDSVEGEEVLAEHFPAGAVQPALVVVDETLLDDVVQAAEAVEGVASAAPYTGAPGGAPGASEAAPVVVDGRVRVDVVTEAPSDSQDAVDTVADLRAALVDVAPDAIVGGPAAEKLDTQIAGERDLRVIVPVVLVVILLILMLLLRSVVAGLLLMAANVLSFAAAIGISALVFDHVLDWPDADPTVPLYGFVFLVALGVDYSIFLMTRVREEALAVGTRAGVTRGLAVTGGVITSAGLVLATTFAALAVIPLLFLAQLAFIVALGVLVDTFVVRSLLVPGLVHDVGPRTWWPSVLARRPDPGTRAPVEPEGATTGA
ncbi:MMPL domain protein [Cellulomonas flavigena DSM 20109]|uniref:MMPL domain protein n=1 Tax=Cellulomonas flavigena (strain ATCC 482 / DSM 20109 / BCRC 11376 / JCM 18109 / NBRC 3775 / NCIMB 8073 / NRS 134) TaxID=446466 RepID=D5UFX7_CELFN|nr:MMPL family transporter [Cellulomonas flavigena]ADG75000.1 MMPL domain protein [Cellulomonas flavigena DSM 20109]